MVFPAIQSALILAQPWAGLVVKGEKRWELRSRRTLKRERIGIIAKRTGTIIGTVVIEGCTGPLSETELEASGHLHLVSSELRRANPRWRFAWHLTEPQQFPNALPYRHPTGAQSWVTVS